MASPYNQFFNVKHTHVVQNQKKKHIKRGKCFIRMRGRAPLNTKTMVLFVCMWMNVKFHTVMRIPTISFIFTILKPIPNVMQRQRFYLVKRFVDVVAVFGVVLVVISAHLLSVMKFPFVVPFYDWPGKPSFGLYQNPWFSVAFILYKYLIFATQIGYFNQRLNQVVQCTHTHSYIYTKCMCIVYYYGAYRFTFLVLGILTKWKIYA